MTSLAHPDVVVGWRHTKIAVVGDVALDAYWHLEAAPAEYSVETGLPVQRVRSQRYGLGGAANVAANLVSLGVGEVRIIGVRGSDPFGATLVSLLQDVGVDVSGLQDGGPGWDTVVYVKPIRGGEEEPRIDVGTREPVTDSLLEQVLMDLHAAAGWADAVIINQQVAGSFAQPGVVESINAIIAAHPETLFFVDARSVALEFRGAILKLNCREAAVLVEGRAPDGVMTADQVRLMAAKLSDQTGHAVVITRGDRGILAACRSGFHEALGIQLTGAVDPVGAGDTVLATLAAALASGQDLATATELANAAAAVVVKKLQTTGTVSAAELSRAAADADFTYDPDLADNPVRAHYLEGSEIELIGSLPEDLSISHAIFDHDGTLSTLRQGWEDVMEPMMIRAVLGTRYSDVDATTYQRIRRDVVAFIDQTTGIQTLAQMTGLVEMVRRCGFVPEQQILDEHGYKAIYNDALMAVVQRRISKLERGELDRQDFHIKGARAVLERLRDRGVALYLASGTDHDDVVAEARALGFEEFFGEQIYGSIGDVAVEAKRVVLERIIREHGLRGSDVVTFGDGPVEMRETRKRGGLAVGLCSDETRRFGANPAKRARLIRGGANLLVPDFSTLDALLRALRLADLQFPTR